MRVLSCPGQELLYSPLVDCVHMTGGTATHDAIVWGSSPEEQARRKQASDPLLKVRPHLRGGPACGREGAALHEATSERGRGAKGDERTHTRMPE